MKEYKCFLLFMLLSCSAHADLYKCLVDGKPIFSERPCAPNAQKISGDDGTISKERQEQAAEVARRERLHSENIDLQKRVDSLERQQRNQTPTQQTSKESKKARCDKLLRTAKDAKDESNKWRYHQGLIDDAKRRQKEAEDAHFSECYGTVFSSN